MSAINKILVPTDFSKCAGNALNFALEIAARTEAKVHVVHAVQPNEHIGDGAFSGLWFDEYFVRRQDDLQKWTGRYFKNEAFKEVKMTISCEVGYTVDIVKTLAREKKADLIVMGTTGATNLQAAFWGSNTSGVVGAVKVPVLAVPEKTNFTKMADYVLATDYGIELDKHSMKVLKEILHIQHAVLHVLHILDKPGEQPDPKAEAHILNIFKEVPLEFRYLHDQNIPKAVNNYIESVNAQGLISISHQHGFLYKLLFKSTAKALVQKARIPTLVLHG